MTRGCVDLKRRHVLRPRIRTIVAALLAGLWLTSTPPAFATSGAPIQLAQSATDLLQLGKEAIGLDEQTPEGEAGTGITNGVPFLVRFRDTVGGLRPGAAVHVRGMQMGAVREVRITFDPATASFDIPVVIELDPMPFKQGEATEAHAGPVRNAVAAMVRKGLRAELGAANLIPGGLAVMLELQPDAAPAELRQDEGELPEIPTTGKPPESLPAQVERVVAHVVALPLEQIAAETNELIAAVRRIVEDPALKQLLANLAQTSEALVPAAQRLDPTLRAAADMTAQAGAALAETQGLLDESKTLPHATDRALKELTSAARSLRLLADMLERQPQALLRGKGS